VSHTDIQTPDTSNPAKEVLLTYIITFFAAAVASQRQHQMLLLCCLWLLLVPLQPEPTCLCLTQPVPDQLAAPCLLLRLIAQQAAECGGGAVESFKIGTGPMAQTTGVAAGQRRDVSVQEAAALQHDRAHAATMVHNTM
jgi:hypothetical protein